MEGNIETAQGFTIRYHYVSKGCLLRREGSAEALCLECLLSGWCGFGCMTLAQAYSEVNFSLVSNFFLTTFPTNMLKFPVFEAWDSEFGGEFPTQTRELLPIAGPRSELHEDLHILWG